MEKMYRAQQSSEAKDSSPSEEVDDSLRQKSTIIEFIKNRRGEVTSDVILRELQIDIKANSYLLDLIMIDNKIEVIFPDDITDIEDCEEITLRYNDKFNIRNKEELVQFIHREGSVSDKDLLDCYDGIDDDINDLIMCGLDIIAVQNKEKTRVLYPRKKPFLVPLSGTVTARVNSNEVRTSVDLRNEIRRGDCILLHAESVTQDIKKFFVGNEFRDPNTTFVSYNSAYRVSSEIGSGREAEQTLLSRPPLSVSSIKEMQKNERHTFCYEFSEKKLPLHDTFSSGVGSGDWRGTALKHGCTNDIRGLWRVIGESLHRDGIVTTDLSRLERELFNCKLISKPLKDLTVPTRTNDNENNNGKKRKRRYIPRRK